MQISCVEYHPNFLKKANLLYQKFRKFKFKVRNVQDDTNNNLYKLNRATCVFGDEDIMDAPPKIWGAENPIQTWTPELLQIKQQIEALTGKKYNVCLCNYYANGDRSIGWHSDNEEKGSVSSIASISLGAERVFELKNKETQAVTKFLLENGSLFLMKQGCQEHYTHRLPPDPQCRGGRINLTFRLFDKTRYAQK